MATVPVLPITPVPLEINISDMTTGTLNGTGTFDSLMRACKVHLAEEYTKGRITGNDFAQVYLGTMNNIIDKSMMYALNQEKTNLELQNLQIQNQVLELNKTKALIDIEIGNQTLLKLIEETDNLKNHNGFHG